MSRPKGSKNLKPGDVVKVPAGVSLGTIMFPEPKKKLIILLDAAMPADSGLTNNQLRATIRETRAKLNEIINILNVR